MRLRIPLWIVLSLVALSSLAQPRAAELRLAVPRTLDLAHVQPANFAAALGSDPTKIFEFVRDQVRTEIYTGALRGPRGTLLALAGNSVDRATLLASLLQAAGHRVRYARGKLPADTARRLAQTMATDRRAPLPPDTPAVAADPMQATIKAVATGAKRDYTLIRDRLKNANASGAQDPVVTLDTLAAEAQDHYWIQWWKDGAWVDADPSFHDASPGKKLTGVAESFDVLPAALFHFVELRVQIEEYTDDKVSRRVILTEKARAADLSGIDLVLTHAPENWTGPTTNLQSALSAAIGDTGKVKPVLLIGDEKWKAGSAFRPRPPTGAGIGGIADLLAGAGTRKAVPIATAETIELDFLYPGGRKETVVREIFDIAGKSRRTEGRKLTPDEVKSGTEAPTAFDTTRAIYDLFVTTGDIDPSHLVDVTEDRPRKPNEPLDVRLMLKRLNITFITTADRLLKRVGRAGREILFYPDSARVHITELVASTGAVRLSIDLRRDHARAVRLSPEGDPFQANIVRGVVSGHLERALIDYSTARARARNWAPSISTSYVFDRAAAENVSSILLTTRAAASAELSADVRTRIQEELSEGFLIVAPATPIKVTDRQRFAWWRIHPRSGSTVAETDEGLYQTEYLYVNDRQSRRYYIFSRSTWPYGGAEWRYVGEFEYGTAALSHFIRYALAHPSLITEVLAMAV